MAVQELRIEDATPGALYEVTIPESGRPLFWRTLPEHAAGRRRQPADRLLLLDQRRPRRLLLERGQGARAARAADLQGADGRPALRGRLGAAAAHAPRAASPTSTSATGATTPTASCSPPARRSSAATTTSSGTTSRSRSSRSRSRGIASSPQTGDTLAALYDAYQSALNPDGKRWTTLDVGPISFFVADTRSHRTRDDDPHARLMTEEQWEDLEEWASTLHGPGVLVLPQPLLKSGGSKTDRTLVDFKESDRLGAIFERALGGPEPARHPDPDRRHPHRPAQQRRDRRPARADPRAGRQPRQPRHPVPAAVGPQARRRRRTS